MNFKIIAASLVLTGAAVPASAAVVTSLPGATTYEMPAVNEVTSGPRTFGDGITFTSTYPSAVYGWTQGYGYDQNGESAGLPAIAGLNADEGTVTFSLGRDVAGIGGTLNWACCIYAPASMSIFNSAGDLLETFALSTSTGNLAAPNTFYGFTRAQGDIHSLVLSNGFIALRSLQLQDSLVSGAPEPATWAMMLIGFGMAGTFLRRRNNALARVTYT